MVRGDYYFGFMAVLLSDEASRDDAVAAIDVLLNINYR